MIEIYRDSFGVPHIVCDDFNDGARATALCHCEDDFFSIQLWLLAVNKKAGRFDDWDGVYLDFLYEFFNIEKAVSKLKAQISKEYLSAVSYYCNGINEYAESHSDQILDTGIFPVSADKVIEAQHLLEIVGIQLDKPYSYLRGPKKRSKGFPNKEGSNILAVSGNHTRCGNSIIAISPHQPLEGIFSFYEIHLFYRKSGCELFGFILPITFTIFMGTNFKVAWGTTASYPDMYSVYKVGLKGVFNKRLNVTEGLIPLNRSAYFNYTLLYGKFPAPIVKQYFTTPDGKPIVKINHRYFLIDIPLIGYKLGTELNYRISHAQSNNEILALTLDYGYPYLDLVSIDTKNNILYVHNSHEPIRASEDEYMSDILSLDSLTQLDNGFEDGMFYIENPKSGYICSANQSPLKTDNDCRRFNKNGLHYYNDNSRSTRIKNLLETEIAKGKIDLETLANFFSDTRVILPIVRGIDFSVIYEVVAHGNRGFLLDILQKWDGEADIMSEGAAVFALLFYRYKDMYYTYHKNPDTIKVASASEINECLDWVSKRYVKGMTLGSIQFIKRGSVSKPIGGIPDSVNTIRSYFEKDKLVAEEGCAFRMLINLNERDIRTCHPYGTSSDEAAEHYTSQLDLFLNNEYKQLRPMTYYKQNYKSKMIIK